MAKKTAAGCLVATALLLAGCPVSCQVLNHVEYSNGTRVGVINKFSRKGYIWKTHEGQMALEGITSSGTTVGANVWEFSLDNSRKHGENLGNLGSEIQRYMESGTKVRVNYVQPVIAWPWRGSTDYFIQSVEPLTGQQ